MKRDNKTNHADLSPVRDAAKQLAALLPDPENPGREAWCFFHFQINDYGAVERVVRLAWEQKKKWDHAQGAPYFFLSANSVSGFPTGQKRRTAAITNSQIILGADGFAPKEGFQKLESNLLVHFRH